MAEYYTSEDFLEDTPPRIMGSETEYNVRHLDDKIDFQPYVAQQFYRTRSGDDGKNLWLENGARLYLDYGGLVEYATPESLSARDVTIHEKAGEIIVREMANRMRGKTNPACKRSGYDNVFVDDNLEIEKITAGHHENYATPLYSRADQGWENYPTDRGLSAYLATRAVWAGSGIVGQNGYALSQKQNLIHFEEHSKQAGSGIKSAYIIHSSEDFNRLEVRLGDGNMSDWAIQQKYALTSLVLRLIEHGDFPEYLYLNDSGTNTFTRTSFNQPIATIHRYMLPATHQRMIAEAGLRFATAHPNVPEEEIDAAIEVIEACEAIETIGENFENAYELAGRVDWAAKLAYLREKNIGSLSTANLDAVMLDLLWEDIAAGGAARTWYEDRQEGEPVTPEQLALASIAPPITRALARTAALAELSNYPNSIDWDRIEHDGQLHRFSNPYDYEL